MVSCCTMETTIILQWSSIKVMSRSAMTPAASQDMPSTGKVPCALWMAEVYCHCWLIPDGKVAFVFLYLMSNLCFPLPVLRLSTMASSTQWSWWPLTRWWTCPLMGVSLPQWTALGRCGPSTGRLRYTWGVGALSRTHLPPLQALLTTTLLSITTPPPSLCHHRNQPLPSTMQPFNPVLPPPKPKPYPPPTPSPPSVMTVFARGHILTHNTKICIDLPLCHMHTFIMNK